MPKQREHKEWFFPLERPKCRSCGARWPRENTATGFKHKAQRYNENKVWGWYEYLSVKKRLVRDICPKCVHEVRPLLQAHADPCGCKFVLVINTCMSPLEDKVRLALLEIERELNNHDAIR